MEIIISPHYFFDLQFTASVEDKDLDYISDAVVDTGEFLHGISSDPRKMKCLEVFARCQPIVRWIRQETKGNAIRLCCYT